MPASSLSRLSVPAGDAGPGEALLMPKLQFRFRVLFENFGLGDRLDLTRQVIDCSRPQVEFTEIPLEVYNSRIYIAGKPTWQALSINIRDDATNRVSSLVGSQLQRQFDFFEQASASAGGNYKFQMKCQILDGGNGTDGPVILESWDLYGCYIASSNYNALNYGTNEPVTISLSIRFDNASQSPTDSTNLAEGVGFEIGSRIPANAGADTATTS